MALASMAAAINSQTRPGRQPVMPDGADGEDKQQQVADGVGKRDGDSPHIAMGVADDRRQDQCGAHGGGGEAADDAVEPHTDAQLAQMSADEQDDGDVAAGIEGEKEDVIQGDAAGGQARPLKEEREKQFAEAPAEHAARSSARRRAEP